MGEIKDHRLQLRQRKELISAIKLKAGVEEISMNEAINCAISQYIKFGGGNSIEKKSQRVMVLLPQKMYDSLSELARAQGKSVNKSVEEAVEIYVAGPVYHNNELDTLREKNKKILEALNQEFGAMKSMWEHIQHLEEEIIPKKKEPERQQQIKREMENLWSLMTQMKDKINKIDHNTSW